VRFLSLLVLIQLFLAPVYSAENIDFRFQRKSYHFTLSTKGESTKIHWKKSGFEIVKEGKLKSCWKKTFNKEVFNIRNSLSVSNKRKVLGDKTLFSWNGREVIKSLLPKEMIRLDKKFTHLFNLLKTGEGKCPK
jgi:hypothetical protein